MSCVPLANLLVKVLHLVDGDKLAMGYLYEATNRPRKISIDTMRTRGRNDSLDERRYKVWLMSDRTILSIIQFMKQGSMSTPHTLMHVVLDLMLRWWMGFSNVFRGWYWLSLNAHIFPNKWRYIGWPSRHLVFMWLSKTRPLGCQLIFKYNLFWTFKL